jgi:hypothetical protein
MTELKRRDSLTVRRDGEEIEVFNWCSLTQHHTVRLTTQETWTPDIERGDGGTTPKYVTEWLADRLWREYDVHVQDYGIEVIDIESDGVSVL